MRRLSPGFVSFLALIAPCAALAQQAPTDTAAENPATSLRRWLLKTAATGPTAFEVRWLQLVSPLGAGARAPEVKMATGTFAPDLLLVQAQGATALAWLQVGRHSLLRENDGPWRYAKLVPEGTDPPLLLRALAAELTTIAARSIVERGGAAVEQVTVCLSAAQADRLVTAGAVFELSQARNARQMVKAGRITENEVPVPTVDVCFDVDVATRRIRRIHLRAISTTVDLPSLLKRAPARPAAPAQPVEAPAKGEPAPALEPLQCKDGLPVRDEKRKQVVWVEIVLRDHGEAPAVVLDETQRALLGR
jgi:hypothetical protein